MRLEIATMAVRYRMGAQVYETEIVSRAEGALAKVSDNWEFSHKVVRSLRSDLPGTMRLPIGMLERAGNATRRMIGKLAYPRDAVVHRMGLSLPPSPGEIVTLHDTVAWRYPDEGSPITAAGAELRDASAVVCVSESTAADAVELFGLTNVRVVYPGVDERFRNPMPLTPSTREGLGLRGRYVLHAGGASERKNLAGLADAWSQLHSSFPDVSLALAGPPHPRRAELFRALPRVVFLGRVSDALVPGLLAGADAVVVPSLYEGFGLPVIESMAAGTPTVVASTSSLVEVAGDAAILVRTTGPEIADGIAAVLSQAIDCESLVAKGKLRASTFSWERCAQEHAAIWNDVGVSRCEKS